MDKVAKEVWCEALRSGEFKQGRGTLKCNGKYCCLGVAKEIFPALTGGTRNPDTHRKQDLSQDDLDLLDLTCDEGVALINHNDGYERYDKRVGAYFREPPKSFNQIADWIEKNL